jgi:glycosyltransferase involved in cell wall biosynthesis
MASGKRSPGDGWPYEEPAGLPLPPALMGGRRWPKISIVTPSYNQGRFLEETILSVARQGYPEVEHIVIDGGSTDETPTVLELYRDRLAYVASERDRGQSHAINKGMSRASGDILTWLNSDDMLAPGALAAVAMAFVSSNADMVSGICEIWADGELAERHLTSCPDGPLPLDELLDQEGYWNRGRFFYQPEVMFTRELWERAGGRVDESLFYSLDYELWVRFAEAGARLHVIGRPVSRFRRHTGQKTREEAKFKSELAEWRARYCQRTGRPAPAEAAGPAAKLRNRIRVVFLNDLGYRYGAGIAHSRLAQAIAWGGHDVRAISLVDDMLPPDHVPDYTNSEVLKAVAQHEPDLVVLGNLHGARADPSLVRMLSERYPVCSVLHDLWLLTGRCGYPGECRKYLEGCDASCPTAHEYPQLPPARIAQAWNTKRQLFATAPPFLFANSGWTAAFARTTLPASEARILTVHLGVPTDVFHPMDKGRCRRALGLPEDRFIVLATSEFADARKGMDHLIAALRQLDLPDVLLVSTSWSAPDPAKLGAIPLQRLGYVRDQKELATVYAAADVLVGPSLEETFGQMFIEAAACGTPAVGHPVSGVKEAIADGISGLVATGIGGEHLARAIHELYRDAELREAMGVWGRLHAENERSLFASYRTIFGALERTGLREQFRLPPKIGFMAQTPALPAVQRLADSAAPNSTASGLCATEGPIAEHGLPKFRWALGPRTRMSLEAKSEGPHTLAILYRNIHEGQTVSVYMNGSHMGDYRVAHSGIKASRLLVCDVLARRGENILELRFSRWFRPHENHRPLALLIIRTTIVPAPETSAANG